MRLCFAIPCLIILVIPVSRGFAASQAELLNQAVPLPQLLYVKGWSDDVELDVKTWQGSLCLDLDRNMIRLYPYGALLEGWTRFEAGCLTTAVTLPSALESVFEYRFGAYWISGLGFYDLPVLDVTPRERRFSGFFWLWFAPAPSTIYPAVINEDPSAINARRSAATMNSFKPEPISP